MPEASIDELREYFKLPRENFGNCDPLTWWAGRRSQFPNLSRFARNILSIPGMILIVISTQLTTYTYALLTGCAVAVERIFSGGRDTISLHRASLKPDTIRTLMLVKQRLRLARSAICDILGH